MIIRIEKFLKVPLMDLSCTTLLIPSSQGWVLWSPGSQIQPDEYLQYQKEVKWIIAPNLYHVAGVSKAKRAFPNAQIWGPVGCREKKPMIQWTGVFGVDPFPIEHELAPISIQGMPKTNEVVFFHRETKSLIVADLAFHVLKPQKFWATMIYRLAGTFNHFAVSRIFLRLLKNKTAFEESVRKVLNWPFETIWVAHGEPLQNDAKRNFLKAMQERGYLKGVKP